MSHQDQNITRNQHVRFNKLIAQRKRGMPVAYLTGSREFYKLDFFVTKDTLVPRPETEILVEQAIKTVREKHKQLPDKKKLLIADIGTGTGCIAITLAKYLPNVRVIAVDISPKALLVAKKNAKKHVVLKSTTFIKGDLLFPFIKKKVKEVKKQATPDVVVANLPYLTVNELHNVSHEPRQALDGGKLGLEYIEQLLMQAAESLPIETTILLEIAPTQTKAVDYMVEQHMPTKKVSFVKDLAGLDRVAVIQ